MFDSGSSCRLKHEAGLPKRVVIEFTALSYFDVANWFAVKGCAIAIMPLLLGPLRRQCQWGPTLPIIPGPEFVVVVDVSSVFCISEV